MRFLSRRTRGKRGVLHARRGLAGIWSPLSGRERLVYSAATVGLLVVLVGPRVGANLSDAGSIILSPAAQCSAEDSAWQGISLAEGAPDVGVSQAKSHINELNAAVSQPDTAALSCFGFTPSPDTRTATAITLSLQALNPLETDEPPMEEALTSDEGLQLNTASTALARVESRAEPKTPNQFGESSASSLDGVVRIEVSADLGETWQSLHLAGSELLSQRTPHLSILLPERYASDLSQLAVRIEVVADGEQFSLLVDSVFVTYIKSQPRELSVVAKDQRSVGPDALPILSDAQSPQLQLKSKQPNDGLVQGLGNKLADTVTGQDRPFVKLAGKIQHADSGRVMDVDAEAEWVSSDLANADAWDVVLDMPPDISPGQYSLELAVTTESGAVQTVAQDFLWGVLAINTNKTVYSPDESGAVAISVLDERGAPVCDGSLTLEIESPSGAATQYTTATNTLSVSQTCTLYGDHIEPDFYTDHSFSGAGEHTLALTAVTDNGSFSIVDYVLVEEAPPVSIERIGPTRILPTVDYPMLIEVTPSQDFKGTIVERVPRSFNTAALAFAEAPTSSRTVGETTELVWDLTIAAGETARLGYEFDPPDIAPEFYLLGPATLQADGADNNYFEEFRQWQIAGDAIGDIAIYRDSNGTHDTNNTAYTGVPFNVLQTEGAAFTQNANDIDVDLGDAGHYLFGYVVQGRNDTYNSRMSFRTRATVGGTEQVIGQGQGYRRSSNNDRYYAYGYGIVDAAANDDFRIEAIRDGTNSSAHNLEADRSSLWLLKLDDTWNYARLAGQDNQSTTTALQNINFTTQTELDSGSFSHSTGTNPEQITLTETGHYLIAYSVGVDGVVDRTSVTTNLTLNGTPIEQSYDFVYMRGSNSNDEGTASNLSIIEATANDILRLQWGATGADLVNGSTTRADRTAITIVKLPDTAEYLRVHESGGGQDVGGNGTNVVIHDTEDEEDAGSFSHNTTTGVTTVQKDADYLFTAGARTNRGTTGSTRITAGGAWHVGGTRQTVGNTGFYTKGNGGSDDAYDGGWSAAGVFNLSASDTVDFREIDEGDNGNADQFQADSYGITAVNIDTLFTPPPAAETNQLHYRWRDDSTDLNTTGGWLAAEDADPASRDKLSTTRLRIAVANEGGDEGSGRTYELQFADKTGVSACSDITSWTGIADSTTDAVHPALTTHIDPDGESTTSGLLANTESYTYTNGEGRKSADTTGTIGPLTADYFTELEYALELTDEAVTNHTYCFRLYDTTANAVLDNYIEFPELTVTTATAASGLGEAGTFTSAADGGWTTINFDGNYTTPVVVGLSNSHNGQEALVFQARSVTSTSAQMRLCESEGATSTGCDTHAAETVGYMVIDAAVADTTAGIEAGTVSISGEDDTTNVTTNWPSETFSATPFVLANLNSDVDADQPTEVVINSRSTTQFNAGICQHLNGSNDNCDGTHASETVGYVAIEPGNEPFFEDFRQNVQSIDTDSTTWQAITFTPAFAKTPALLMASQTDTGGQDVEIDQGRSVTTSGADIRFCEIDTTDTCDTHSADTVGWIAIEEGEFQDNYHLDQDGFRIYQNTDAIQPSTALGNENEDVVNVDDTDVVRIRMAVQNGVADIGTSQFDLKLQYRQTSDCTAAGSWTDVGGTGSGTIWRGFDNATPADGATITASLLDGAGNELMSYEEANNSVTNPNTLADGERGEWDWVVQNNGATALTDYCFRAVMSDGTAIQYTRYPKITTASAEAPLDPDDPTNLAQEKTTATVIATGDSTNEASVVFKADVSDQNLADVLKLCVEVQPVETAFTDTETACGATVAYSGTAVEASVTITGLLNPLGYHWQALVEDAAGARSAWASYGGNGETADDFVIDTVAPNLIVYDGTTTGVDIDYNNGDLDELSANWEAIEGTEPDDIASLAVWLDGQDIDGDGDTGDNPSNGSAISTWTDKSANGNDAVDTGFSSPSYDATNNVIDFADATEKLAATAMTGHTTGNAAKTFMVVHHLNGTADDDGGGVRLGGTDGTASGQMHLNETRRVRYGGGNDQFNRSLTSSLSLTTLSTSAGNSTNMTMYVDGEDIGNGADTTTWNFGDDLYINADWTTATAQTDTPADISVAEIVVFDAQLSTTDREAIEQYLMCKWDIIDCANTFERSIGTSPGGTDVLTWTSSGTSSSATDGSLTLNTSQPYYYNIRVTDPAGNQTIVSSDGVFIAPTLSFSTSPGNVLFDSLNPGNSFTDTEVTTLTTSTNAYNGYTIRAFVTGLLTSPASDTVGFFDGGTYASPDEWLSGDTGYGYTSNDTSIQGVNKFNGSPCAGGGNPPCYAPFSTTGPGDIIADHTALVSGTPVTNENFLITHRVTTNDNQAPGTYETNVIYVITATY